MTTSITRLSHPSLNCSLRLTSLSGVPIATLVYGTLKTNTQTSSKKIRLSTIGPLARCLSERMAWILSGSRMVMTMWPVYPSRKHLIQLQSWLLSSSASLSFYCLSCTCGCSHGWSSTASSNKTTNSKRSRFSHQTLNLRSALSLKQCSEHRELISSSCKERNLLKPRCKLTSKDKSLRIRRLQLRVPWYQGLSMHSTWMVKSLRDSATTHKTCLVTRKSKMIETNRTLW